MKKLSITICLFMAVALMPSKSYSQEVVKPQLLIVKFHADWCGSCKSIGPALKDLTNKLDGKKILFVKLDFTNNTTKRQSNMLASALGIEKVVAKNNGTGFLLVIDTNTKKVMAKLTKAQTTKEMGKKIVSLL